MNLITPLSDFCKIKSRGFIEILCEHCNKSFKRTKNEVQKVIAGHKKITLRFCSRKCIFDYKTKNGNISFKCETCNKDISKHKGKFLKSKHHFCSHSCAAKYSNKYRKSGNKRSKAEDFLVNLIKEKFPNIKIVTNDRKTLSNNLEIDIWLPELPLAIELNGPVHYFNLWGKLEEIQNRDFLKQKELQIKNIPLILYNISQFKNRKACFAFLKAEFQNLEKIIGQVDGLRSHSVPFTAEEATITSRT